MKQAPTPLSLVLAIFLASCADPPAAPSDGLVVVTTFHALSTLVAPLLVPGDTLHVMLPGGASPHAYEPRPSDVRRLAGAGLLVAVGPGVDEWAASLGAAPVVRLLDTVSDSVRETVRSAADPHVWLDPLAVRSGIAGLVDALCVANAASCDRYRERAAAFSDTLLAVDRRTGVRLHDRRRQTAIASGPFLAHWSRRYGPRIVDVIETVEGVEPSASRIRMMISTARGTAGVIGQDRLPSDGARAVAEAAGVPYVAVDPLGSPGATPDYRAFITAIAQSVERLPIR